MANIHLKIDLYVAKNERRHYQLSTHTLTFPN